MTTESRLISFRIDPSIMALIGRMADEVPITKSLMIEKLVLDEALRRGWVDKNNNDLAVFTLFDWIRRKSEVTPNPDYTLNVFEKIQDTPEALRLWDRAVVPQVGERPEKRRQYVNARIGKFCKLNTNWESDVEVLLPKNSEELIKGYTRLKPK